MNNFKMTLQYDGTRYLGWTKNEKSVKTVSYKLEPGSYATCSDCL